MKTVVSRLCGVLLTLLAVAGAFARLFQLLRYTDSDTGLVLSHTGFSTFIYTLFPVALLLAIGYAAFGRRSNPVLRLQDKGPLGICLFLFGAACFYDFLHQCCTIYDCMQTQGTAEYTYVVLLVLFAAAALLCSGYSFAVLRYVRGVRCDLRKLGPLHLAPALWAFFRLLLLMMQIVDFRENPENFCEFVFLSLLLCFFFSLVLTLDRQEKTVSLLYFVLGAMTFFSACVVALPRILAEVTGRLSLIPKSTFSAVTYLLAGILAAALVLCVQENRQKTNENAE